MGDSKKAFVKNFLEYLHSHAIGNDGVFANYFYLNEIAPHLKINAVLGVSSDGVGSKLNRYVEHGNLYSAAFDLIAMGDDLSCEYINPLVFSNYLGLNNPIICHARQMGAGLGDALKEDFIFNGGGETAFLPDQLKENCLDWVGFVVGIENDIERHKSYIERRDSLENGLLIYGIPDESLGSNGFTLIKELPLRDEFIWPSRIYTPKILLARDYSNFFAHITGGGYRNIGRVLPSCLDAVVELNEIPDIFKYIQDSCGFSDKVMFENYHMGFRLVLGTENPDDIKRIFPDACLIGELTDGAGRVSVNDFVLDPY